MANIHPPDLSDRDLLSATEQAAARERQATAMLLALLAEVDTRRLYLAEGYSSLFQYAMRRLHLSEPAAYSRITASRAARRYPALLSLVDGGELSLTTIGLFAPHLDDENWESLVDAARHKSKREVEVIVAALHPQPDIAANVRMLPVERRMAAVTAAAAGPDVPNVASTSLLDRSATAPSIRRSMPGPAGTTPAISVAVRNRNSIAPLGPRRYLIRMTVDEHTGEAGPGE